MNITYISLDTYGDFDMRYTDSVWYCEGNRDVNSITSAFRATYGIDCKLDCLPYNMKRDTLETFKKYLKKEGFKPVKMKTVVIAD